MNDAAIVRGMSTGEGAHGRARYYMHTGYKEGGRRPDLSQHRLDRRLGNRRSELPAAQLRQRRRPLLWLRLPRHPASRRSSSTTRPAASKTSSRWSIRSSSTAASNCCRSWKRPSITTTRPASAPITRPPTTAPSTMMHSKEAKAFDLSAEPECHAQDLRQHPLRRRLHPGSPAGRDRRVVRRGQPRRLGHPPGQFRPRQDAVDAGRPGHFRPA